MDGQGNRGMKLKALFAWLAAVTFPCYLLDQWTKWLIYSRMEIGDGYTLIPGFFDIIHSRNTGAAFGMLQGLPETYRTLFFGIITLIACVAISVIFVRTNDHSWLLKAVFSLIIAGALGNLTDRFLFNEVVDFLSLHVGRFRWPTFNLADTWISAGMIGLIIHSFLIPGKD